MSYSTKNYVSQTIVVEECWVCGVHFGITETFWRRRQNDGGTFFCPKGCRISYGEGQVTKLKRQLEEAETRRKWERDQREATERSLTATRGVVTKLKKRASAGVCPCCNRQFQNVKLHVSRKHPEFVKEQGTKIEKYVKPEPEKADA